MWISFSYNNHAMQKLIVQMQIKIPKDNKPLKNGKTWVMLCNASHKSMGRKWKIIEAAHA